jgi:nicotinamide-nucleotide amidase
MDVFEKLKSIIDDFTERNIQIAIAESCTGGYISHIITNISGASKVFERGVVTYSNQAKIDILDVDPDTLKKFGAVSEPIARQMAENLRNIAKVDIGVSTTGIAGPTGATPEKPVGLVFIGFSTEKETIVKKFVFKTDRIGHKEMVLEEIVLFLDSLIKK